MITGATAVAGGHASKKVSVLGLTAFGWDAQRLVFTVREPYPSLTSQAGLVFGDIRPRSRTCHSLPDARWRRHLATLPIGNQGGAVGVTFAPGKHQAQAMTGIWARDLDLDLLAIRDWGSANLDHAHRAI